MFCWPQCIGESSEHERDIIASRDSIAADVVLIVPLNNQSILFITPSGWKTKYCHYNHSNLFRILATAFKWRRWITSVSTLHPAIIVRTPVSLDPTPKPPIFLKMYLPTGIINFTRAASALAYSVQHRSNVDLQLVVANHMVKRWSS